MNKQWLCCSSLLHQEQLGNLLANKNNMSSPSPSSSPNSNENMDCSNDIIEQPYKVV